MSDTQADLRVALDRLTTVDTCAVSDALDRLGIRGAAADLRPLSAPRRIAGRAITVRLDVIEPDRPGPGATPPRHLCTAAVESGGPGTVIVVAHPGTAAAGWGGLLSLAAVLRGIEGVVVDGPARDIDEAVALGFTVFARSATPVTARGRIREVAWNVPVTVAGCAVATDDLVLADRSGVVFIPANRADEVLTVASGLAAREAELARAIRRGDPVSAVMGRAYEHLLHQPAGETDR